MMPSGGIRIAIGRALATAVPVIALAALLSGCTRPSSPAAVRWELVWADEFDGPAGTPPDPARWRYDIGTDWGNAQLEYDTARPENVSLDGNGRLAITAPAWHRTQSDFPAQLAIATRSRTVRRCATTTDPDRQLGRLFLLTQSVTAASDRHTVYYKLPVINNRRPKNAPISKKPIASESPPRCVACGRR